MSPDDAGGAGARSPGLALLGSELSVLFRRRRTWALLGALAAVPVLIAIAVRLSSEPNSPGDGPPFLDSITQNGLFVAVTGLVVSVPLFLPLTVGVVAGDTIAGEANLGTLRYLLVSPAGRIRLLLVKYAGTVVFCVVATLVMVVAGVLIGAALFPIGPVTLISGDTIGVGGFALRALLVAAYVSVSLLGLSAIGLFISTLTTVPVGAMAATIVLSAVSQILGALPQLEALHPWLFSDNWLGFADLMRSPIGFETFGDNIVLQLGYIAVFGALAYGRFSTKDVLS
jgi:ABC-2 type transport system permease protein